MLELNQLYNMDCVQGMQLFPDKYFDLAVVDPPYGIGTDKDAYEKSGTVYGNARRGMYSLKNWDSAPPDADYFTELFRVSKHQVIFGANHFISRIPIDSPSWIVWDKENGVTDYADAELAWTSHKTAVRLFAYKWNGFLQGNMKNKEARFHPCQKPVALYEWILSKYASPGDKILDTHAGSAPSMIAAHNLNLDIIAFEIDEEFYTLSTERINAARAQMRIDDLINAGGGSDIHNYTLFNEGVT